MGKRGNWKVEEGNKNENEKNNKEGGKKSDWRFIKKRNNRRNRDGNKKREDRMINNMEENGIFRR